MLRASRALSSLRTSSSRQLCCCYTCNCVGAQFLFAAAREAGDTRYPFSVLGLGDVVVPGAFVSLLRQVDLEGLGPGQGRAEPSSGVAFPYFYAGLAAYAAGLTTTFVANYLTKAGQPALVYIVPSLLITAAATAANRGEMQQLWLYKSQRAEAAKERRDTIRADWRADKALKRGREKGK